MITKQILKSREEWLEARSHTIGGSDAAAVIGLSPWKSNVELWEQKTGISKNKEEIPENPLMTYGINAEPLLRDLFKLDFPGMTVFYEENNRFLNSSFPWAHASLDGWMEDEAGRAGVLEIKTAMIMNAAQSLKWREKIPQNYYVQVLHEMAVMEADFAIVKAQLKREYGGNLTITTSHYIIEREEVQEDIDYLMDAEQAFWESVQMKRKPGLLLPEI